MISNRVVSNNVNLAYFECWRVRHLAESLYLDKKKIGRGKRGMSLASCICCEPVSLNNLLSQCVYVYWKICVNSRGEREEKKKLA